ncbi:MAG TPA: cysteine desulfurase family protein [Terriglobia bacterium]|nr:cysteine desulfurase family protein [Terriglobia bacterium]
MRHVYLDNAATSPLAPEVFEAMKPYFMEQFGNASSVHWYGQQAKAAVEEARAQVARLLNARPAEVIFTSGGTESDNEALFGVVEAAGSRPGGNGGGGAGGDTGPAHIITTTIEHHAVLHSAQVLERRGVAVTYLPVGADGIVDPADLERAIRPETVLISVMFANNELGTVQPVEEIGRIARERGICFHTDAVQAVGKIPVDVEQLRLDLLSLSAHKFHGPKGTGAMYIRKGTNLAPLIYGGHHERDRRAGTENVPGIVGLGKAAALASACLECSARLAALRDQLENGLLTRVPGTAVNGDRARRVPGTANLRFDGVEAGSLVIALDLQGIACSAGSACSSGSATPSHVLTAIGLSADQARSSVRFSLGHSTTTEDVEYTLEILPPVVEQLREESRKSRVKSQK